MFPSSVANVQRIQLLENQRASTIGLLIEGILYTSRHVDGPAVFNSGGEQN